MKKERIDQLLGIFRVPACVFLGGGMTIKTLHSSLGSKRIVRADLDNTVREVDRCLESLNHLPPDPPLLS